MRHRLFLFFLCGWILKCGHGRNVNRNVNTSRISYVFDFVFEDVRRYVCCAFEFSQISASRRVDLGQALCRSFCGQWKPEITQKIIGKETGLSTSVFETACLLPPGSETSSLMIVNDMRSWSTLPQKHANNRG